MGKHMEDINFLEVKKNMNTTKPLSKRVAFLVG